MSLYNFFLDFTYKRYHIFVFLCPTSLSMTISRSIHVAETITFKGQYIAPWHSMWIYRRNHWQSLFPRLSLCMNHFWLLILWQHTYEFLVTKFMWQEGGQVAPTMSLVVREDRLTFKTLVTDTNTGKEWKGDDLGGGGKSRTGIRRGQMWAQGASPAH